MIAEQTALSTPEVARLLGLLVHYQMVYVEPDPMTEFAHAHV